MAEFPTRRTCGTHDVHLAMLRSNPDYARARTTIETRGRNLALAGPAERAGPYRIPVVAHVIYRAAEENISDQQITSQIDVLNRDFRMKNPDVTNVPAPFKQFASDAQIEFALASRDPKGQPTNGITRTQPTVPRFFEPISEHLGLSGDHQKGQWSTVTGVRPISRRPAGHRWRRDPPQGFRDDRHCGCAIRPWPHRHPRDRPLARPLPHLGRQKRLHRRRPGGRHAEAATGELRHAELSACYLR